MIAKACPEYSLDKPTTLVAISGAGNVAQFTALKVIELGATVLSLSDSKGSLISDKGFTKDVVLQIGQLKLKGGYLESLPNILGEGYTYYAGMWNHTSHNACVKVFSGKRPWTLIPRLHIALPGATQNEVSKEEAEALIKAGVRIVAEGSNMVSISPYSNFSFLLTSFLPSSSRVARKRRSPFSRLPESRGLAACGMLPGVRIFPHSNRAFILIILLFLQRLQIVVGSQFLVSRWLRTVRGSRGHLKMSMPN